MVAYGENSNVLKGLPTQIAQYDISDATKEEKTEKCSFTMRVNNNIHNVPVLEEVEFVQEWTEEEKIPIKASPPPAPAKDEKKKDEGKDKKEKEKPAETEEKPAEPEQ